MAKWRDTPHLGVFRADTHTQPSIGDSLPLCNGGGGHTKPRGLGRLEAAAVMRFRRSVAPSPSDLRPGHVHEMPRGPDANEIAIHPTSIVQLFAASRAPPTLARFIQGVLLHALPEKSGGVRPIAAGEISAAPTCCMRWATREGAILFPAKIGCCPPNGHRSRDSHDAAMVRTGMWATRPLDLPRCECGPRQVTPCCTRRTPRRTDAWMVIPLCAGLKRLPRPCCSRSGLSRVCRCASNQLRRRSTAVGILGGISSRSSLRPRRGRNTP